MKFGVTRWMVRSLQSTPHSDTHHIAQMKLICPMNLIGMRGLHALQGTNSSSLFGLLSNKHITIPIIEGFQPTTNSETPLSPCALCNFWGKGGIFKSCPRVPKLMPGYDFWGLVEMFEGNFADTCTNKNSLVLWGAEQRVQHAQAQKRGPPSAI
jgi:hypothetical protein